MVRSQEFTVTPIVASANLRTLVYEALKAAIAEMDIYGSPEEIRLDERRLARDLGVSRTPVREAFTVLEQEGFVRSEARRGVFVVRKTRRQIIDMIHAWAALEGMAARLACQRATDAELAGLETLFADFLERPPADSLDAYSDANLRFHQAVIALGQCKIVEAMSGTLMIHVRGIRRVAIRAEGRADRSNAEHRAILRALRGRDGDGAEALVRAHGLGLAAHVERFGDALG
ncbi:transcriptional regulator, GntR family [Methylobacterium sp. 4-46]|uniref:GntR family transcriptional regulator n=1 Tax=unclassified Methylobacterium TaxID=2615210 RepID=UPI000152CBB8|nr:MULTISPECIES: GntR family transcriptional regulator [Methylobacterium]ACA18411.1 transcriptional regulator, GntR family [Methylobacterium sp. 4-46]WFT83615.1 GntR family transcriptional regulator [Methylobacterium nodulans]